METSFENSTQQNGIHHQSLNATYNGAANMSSSSSVGGFKDPIDILMAAFLSFLIVATLAGNFLLCRTVLVTRRLWLSPYFMLASLAVADFLVGLIVLPVSLAYHVAYQTEGRWSFGVITCDAWILANNLFCIASALNLCAVSWDRYLAVTSPLEYLNRMREDKVKKILVLVWVTSLLFSSIYTYGYHTSEKRTLCNTWGLDIEYFLAQTVCGYIAPVLFLVIVNGKVLVIVRSQVRRIQDHHQLSVITENTHSSGQMFHSKRTEIAKRFQREIRTFKAFLVVIGCFLCCWTPFVAIAALNYFVKVPLLARHVVIVLLYTNSAINFMIYGLFNRDFRKAMMNSLRCKRF